MIKPLKNITRDTNMWPYTQEENDFLSKTRFWGYLLEEISRKKWFVWTRRTILVFGKTEI